MELDAVEDGAGAGDAELLFGRTVDVIEHRFWDLSSRHRPEIVDRVGLSETPPARIGFRWAEFQERSKTGPSGDLSADLARTVFRFGVDVEDFHCRAPSIPSSTRPSRAAREYCVTILIIVPIVAARASKFVQSQRRRRNCLLRLRLRRDPHLRCPWRRPLCLTLVPSKVPPTTSTSVLLRVDPRIRRRWRQ